MCWGRWGLGERWSRTLSYCFAKRFALYKGYPLLSILPLFGSFNVRADVDASDCTQGLYGHRIRVEMQWKWKSTLGEKCLVTPGTWARVTISNNGQRTSFLAKQKLSALDHLSPSPHLPVRPCSPLHSFPAAELFCKPPSVQNAILPHKVQWSSLFLLPGSSYLEPTPNFCSSCCLCRFF